MKSASPASKLLVVLVEDDPGTREVFAIALEMEGFVVVTFETATQALDGISILAPAAVVADLTLPGGVSGADLVRQIRSESPELGAVPFFAVTGWDPKMIPADDTALFTQVFLKPVDVDVVGKAIRAAVAQPE